MYKEIVLFIYFSILTVNSLCAQSLSLEGLILDKASNDPLAFASVSLRAAADSVTVMGGQLSDDAGNFRILAPQAGKYILKVEYIGYESFAVLVNIENEKEVIVGKILLNPSENLLKMVEVNGEKSVVIHKIDRQVYEANKFQNAKGGTAVDILRNLPSISVDINGELNVRGSKGFLVLVNGKPVTGDAATILSQLPANIIENVELITAPSAKFDADGKSGIINIITKKGAINGSTYAVNIQYGLPRLSNYYQAEEPQRHGLDASYSFRKNKFDLALSGSYQRNDNAGQRDGDVFTEINGIRTEFPSFGERSFKKYNYAVRGVINYTSSKSSYWSAGFYNGQRKQFRLADITYDNRKTDLENGQTVGRINYFNSNLVLRQGNFTLGNLDYTYTAPNKDEISISGLYERAVFEGFTKNRNLNINNYSDTLQYVLNTNRSPLNAFRVKADYAKNISEVLWESGYQFRYQSQEGDFLYQDQNLVTKMFVTNQNFSAITDVTNVIHGVYSQVNGAIQKLAYTAGLRYEYSNRKYVDNQTNVPQELRLSNLFPSGNLLYNLTDNFRVKAAYSRRVQRSTNNELNPFPEREHSETLERGDPNILPEFIGITEVGLIKDFDAGSVFLTAYRQDITNYVNRVNSIYNDTILNRIYTNAGKARLLGAESGFTIKPVKWWNSYIGANIYQLRINGSLFENSVLVNNSSVVYSFNTSQTFKFKKDFGLQFNLSYLSQKVTAQGEDSRFFLPDLALTKAFKSKNLSASVQWQNIALGNMKTNQQRITTSGVGFYTTTNYIYETNVVRLNLSYQLNQSSATKKLPKSEFGEREF
jgi:outer membrane receptor protein involved in Fe transport